MSEKKPPREAVAIQYDTERHNAPVAVAIGRGLVAERIVEQAQENKVPIVPDAGLAHALSKLGVGDEIPVELYEVVAQVLIFVHNVDGYYTEKLKK